MFSARKKFSISSLPPAVFHRSFREAPLPLFDFVIIDWCDVFYLFNFFVSIGVSGPHCDSLNRDSGQFEKL